MTAEEIALAALRAQEWQAWLTGLAIILGPLVGVVFTLWSQSRKEKRDAKRHLFMTLMAGRKGGVTPEMARALNTIDVVFADSTKVRAAWQAFYRACNTPNFVEDVNHSWLGLLSAMATELGYKQLQQVDIDKYYLPQAHINDVQFQREMGELWKRVLENTEHFVVAARKDSSTTGYISEAFKKSLMAAKEPPQQS